MPVLMAALVVGGCASPSPLPRADEIRPGTYERVMDRWSGGFRRSYRLHIGAGYEGRPLPLVVVLHGGFSSADLLARRSRLDLLADEEDFVVVYPNGTGISGFARHWNAGHCCAFAKSRRIDDIGFVADVIDEVEQHVAIDERRIYLVGHSNGGMLAYRFAAVRAERVTAVATASSSILGALESDQPGVRMPIPARPVPLIVFHGREDPRVPYDHVARSLDWWAKQNGCDPVPSESRLFGGGALRSRWSGCRGGARIDLYSLVDFGHSWPGAYFTDELEDDPLAGFDAGSVLWGFFEEFSLDPHAPSSAASAATPADPPAPHP